MYEEDIEYDEMREVFGSNIYRILCRNGVYSVEAVKEYIEKYPYDEYSKFKAKYYKHIGPVKYNQIVEALKKWEES